MNNRPNYQPISPKPRTNTISITSGKGGVGKTTTVANLAFALSQRGARVLILDGDLGMANVDIMFGIRANFGIHDVIQGKKRLEDVIVSVAEGVDLIPGGSGVYGLHNLDIYQKQNLLDQVEYLDDGYDFMIIDTAPGIDDNVLYLNSAAQDITVLVTPEPSSLTDAYALVKVLNQRHNETRFSVVCNMVRNKNEALQVYQRLADVATQFLCVSLSYRGFVPLDLNLRQATKSQQLVTRTSGESSSSVAYRKLAENISDLGHMHEPKGSIQFFWRQLSGVA